MKIEKIYVGSWFQRTTLHLSEMYDFFKKGESPLVDLKKKTLQKHRKDLLLENVEMHTGHLDYIHLVAKGGIALKIYEDGLIILLKDPTDNLEGDIKDLTAYYEKKLSPALKYIFSLGAPVPKELANIKTVYPYFVVLKKATQEDVQILLKNAQQEEYFEVKEKTFEIYRGDTFYIINNIGEKLEHIEDFIVEHIFAREFKGQLHRYLNLHRIIWERIADVKERGSIVGKDIKGFRNTIEGYSKAINLIEARINQMSTYIGTRGAIMRANEGLKNFHGVFEFRHEKLNDTLKYVKEIWRMTKNYVDSALDIFSDLQSKATSNSIKNLTVVTSMGVGATLIGLFTKDSAPEFTLFGVGYFFVLALIGYATNKIMKHIYLNKSYGIKDIKADRDIK